MVRALLVIDVQQEYFTGMLPISHPVGHLDRILFVMDAASQAGLPVCVIRHHQADPESPLFCFNCPAWQLHPAVEQRPRSILIDKELCQQAAPDAEMLKTRKNGLRHARSSSEQDHPLLSQDKDNCQNTTPTGLRTAGFRTTPIEALI